MRGFWRSLKTYSGGTLTISSRPKGSSGSCRNTTSHRSRRRADSAKASRRLRTSCGCCGYLLRCAQRFGQAAFPSGTRGRFCGLEDETAQLRAIRLIAENDWTVARTERYVDEQLSAAKGKARLSRFVLRDMRLFLNGINHQLDLIRAAGLNPQTEQEETERELVLTIRIPKSVSGR